MADDRAQQPDLDAEWEALARFLAGESAPDEERRIRERLSSEPDLAVLLESLDAALEPPAQRALSSAEVEAALASVLARREPLKMVAGGVQPSSERPTVRMARIRSRWRHAGLRAAAAVLVVAGGSMLWRAVRPGGEGSRPDAPTAFARNLVTAIGVTDSLRLPDGSRVILGAGSSLGVAAAYGTSSREVTLSGEAFFDVVHDSRSPFVVHTASAVLRDVGTTFTVRSDGERGTRVAVTTGAVDVAARTGSASTVVLRAGDRALVAGDGVHVERGVVSNDELLWTRGQLVFHDASIPEVAAGLRRWFGLELVVTDSSLARRRLNATFDRNAAADVAPVLAAALGAAATRSGDTLTLSPLASPR